MFKKVLLVIFLLLLLVGNHTLAPSKDFSDQIVGSVLQPFQKINIAHAADPDQHSPKAPQHAEAVPWSSYIVPGAAGLFLIIIIGSYWLVFKKRQKKET